MIIVEIPWNLYDKFFGEKHFVNVERCGILVGKRLSEMKFLITDLIEDKSPSYQSRFGVFRTTDHVYPQLLSSIANQSGTDYIGEWHTHPHGPIAASFVDILTMKSMVNNPIFGQINWILLLIVIKYNHNKMYYFTSDKIDVIKLTLL